MELVERGEQFAVLSKLATKSFGGQGQAVLVTGPVACGKTTLLHAASEQFERTGAIVLSATCAETERSLQCGAVGQLLHNAPLGPDSAALVDGLLAAGAAEPGGDAPVGPSPELLHQCNALSLRLLELGADQPVVVAVDDVRHADAASHAFLSQLVRRLRLSRILVLLTDDPEPHGARSPFLVELHRQPHLHRLSVSPLSRAGVSEVIARQIGEVEAACLAPQVLAATGGNPRLVSTFLDDHRSACGLADPAAGAGSASAYGLALVDCLHRGGAGLLEVARALTILADPAPPEQLARMLDREVEAVERALQAMSAAGLSEAGALRHPAARAAVRADTPGDVRGALHQRAAQVLQEAGSPPETVAYHLREAGFAPSPWAFPVLLDAAQQAVTGGGGRAAAAYLRLALRVSPLPPASSTAVVRSRLAEVEWQMDPASAGQHLTALTAAARSGQLPPQETALLVRQLLWHGRTESAAEVWERACRAGTAAGSDPSLDARAVEQWLRYAYPPLASRRQSTVNSTRGGTAVIPLLDPWLHATGTLCDLSARGEPAAAAEHAEQVLSDLLLGRHTGWAEEAVLASVLALVRAERLDLASSWCDRLFASAESRDAHTWSAILAAVQSEVALGQGELTLAREGAEAALSRVPTNAWGVAVGLPLSSLVLANTRLGCFDEAAALLAQPVPEAMFQSRYGLHYLYARGYYRQATRHYHAALADFRSCGELMRHWGLDTAGMPPWRAAAAEAWLRLGNRDQARRLLSDQMSRPHHSPRYRGLALRLLAAAGPANRRPQLLAESLELFESCGDVFEQARVLADLSGAYHALRENRRARMVFRRAVHLAKVCQADPLYRELLSVNQELGEVLITGGDAGQAVLTESERRVASLAAIGYTNREIASKLYITASTVEQHLTRVYRKLNIKHRGELPIELSRRAELRSRVSARS